MVLECTGLFRSREAATGHIGAGAKRVIIGAAPFDSVDAAIVYGVNHHEVKASVTRSFPVCLVLHRLWCLWSKLSMMLLELILRSDDRNSCSDGGSVGTGSCAS